MFQRTLAWVCFACAVVFLFLATADVYSPTSAVLAAFALAAAVAFASMRRRATR